MDKELDLCEACSVGSLERVKKLVEEEGCDPKDPKEVDGLSPLGLAIVNMHPEIEAYLREKGYTIESDHKLLCEASGEVNRLDVVKELVETYSFNQYYVPDGEQLNPVVSAIFSKNTEIESYLRSHGFSVEDGGEYSMQRLLSGAAEEGDLELVTELIEVYGCDPEIEMHDDQMPYSCAIESGNVDLALYLLNQISYPKHQYKYTLKMACEQGRQDVVEEIIEVEWLSLTNHEEVTSCFETAIESGQFDLALYFIKQAGLTDKKYSTKLMFKAIAHLDIAKELIENMHYDPKGVVDSMSDSPLISACHSLGMRLYLFHHGCDTEDDQKTLLSEACRLGRLDVVKSLLEDSQYDPAGVVNHEWYVSGLRCAIMTGQTEVVKYFKQRGVSVSQNDGSELLSTACSNTDKELSFVKTLIEEFGVDPKVVAKNFNYPPLVLAYLHGRPDIVDYLSNQCGCGLDDIDDKDELLCEACQKGDPALRLVKDLVEKYSCDPKAIRYKKAWSGLYENLFPLTLTVMLSSKRSETEEYLRSCGCQLNVEDNVKDIIFYYASTNGRLDLLRELVEVYGCSSDSISNLFGTPMGVAIANEHIDVATYFFIEKNFPLDCANQLLSLACKKGSLQLVKKLVEECYTEVNVRTTDYYSQGHSPLRCALLGGHTEIASYLKQKGAEIEKWGDGSRLLCKASYLGLVDVVRELVEQYEVDPVASSDKHNCTALGLARIEGHKNMEKMLVEYGCSLGSEEQQFSLLLRACELGKLDMVKELVEVHNVNPSKQSTVRRLRKSVVDSAVLKAFRNNHMDIVYYLILEKKCLLSDHTEFYNEEERNTSTVLARACKSGDLELVKKLVEEFQAQTDGRFLTSGGTYSAVDCTTLNHLDDLADYLISLDPQCGTAESGGVKRNVRDDAEQGETCEKKARVQTE